MKLLSFTILLIISVSSYAIEFQSCIDSKGRTHFTNLSIASLDSNCTPKDPYAVMFSQDYLNLGNTHAKYKANSTDSPSIQFNASDLSPGAIKNKVTDIFDSDKAYDELMETVDKRDDFLSNAMKERAKGIQSVMDQAKPDNATE